MTEAKKKAVALIEKFHPYTAKFHQDNAGNGWEIDLYASKQCALICVDTILDEFRKLVDSDSYYTSQRFDYWQEVRNEIINFK